MFIWFETDTWIVVTGVTCAAACAIPGALLVLRQMSMMGDAISHTVLPGLAIAFLITNSREPMPMFIGAVVVGILTAVLVEWVKELGGTDGGTSMGVVFTTLFALGLVLIRRALDSIDLDPSCVLYGAVENAPADLVLMLGYELPRAAVINGAMFLVNLVLLVLLYKEFKISSFDPQLATTLGYNARFMHYLLMTMTATTTVAAFETVGSILVIAMLIVPAATAYLLTQRFGVMIVLAVVIGAISAALGHVAAITVPVWFGFDETVTSGSMAATAGMVFAIVWLVSPRHGLISRFVHRLLLNIRIAREDVLGLLYRAEELQAEALAPSIVREAVTAGPLLTRLAVWRLARGGRIDRAGESLSLTARGRGDAQRLVRSHRLWESYLHKHLGLPSDHVHGSAERLEHVTDPALQDRLYDRVDRLDTDPQGKPIPPGG
jgi:manganese/zinc/iron transport system permease protein